ncbi:hypothetical protein CF15_04420 [Pyrodictium occultum]|uniref:Uncharacterized protein n=1 Tax=Pyrodictium occultum TaxID=2309 RepID=A0A0V8RVG3_PYROC|nr:hypothetical protein [Pyrodictium occultum]KSW12029.1 hypothetical protein CF15_04420 [Pyrodictium occultum]
MTRLPGLREAVEAAPRGGRELLTVLEELADRMALAARRTAPGKAVEVYAMLARAGGLPVAVRGGPPPLSPAQYADFAAETIARLESSGFYEEARPLRSALAAGRLPVYDLARSYLLGDTGFVDHVAEEAGAPAWLVRVLAATLAAGAARAVRLLLEEREALPEARGGACPVCGRPLVEGRCGFCGYGEGRSL